MRVGIQWKVGGFLVAVLAVAFGVSTWVSTAQTTGLLESFGDQSGRLLRKSAFHGARNVFVSLETGTRGSLERGEMETFQTLLAELGSIPGVVEIGLADPSGKVVYATRRESIQQPLEREAFEEAAGTPGRVIEWEAGGDLLLLRSHQMEPDCVRCHEGAKPGDLAGVLYVRYSLKDLADARQEAAAFLARARKRGVVAGAVTGLAGLLAASAGVYLLLGARVRRPLVRLTERVREMASGEADLTHRLPASGRDEMGDLARAFNAFVENLQGLVREVLDTSEQVVEGSREILEASRASLGRAESQKERTEEAAASAQELNATVLEVARSAREAAAAAREASRTAEEGGRTVTQGVEGMDRVESRVRAIAGQVRELGERTAEIGEVMQVIDDIADQTNLLALNAAIEAARAGEHGRGFAVVADEVRKLSEKTAQATRKVRDTVAGIQEEVHRAVESVEEGLGDVERISTMVREGGEALEAIVSQAAQNAERVERIVEATEEQTVAVEGIGRNLDVIAGLASEVASGAEQTQVTAERLRERTERLQELMGRFRV